MAKKKIYLVEDEKDLRDIYQMKFEKSGYEVFVADDGEAFLDNVAAAAPDLVLLDLVMPGLSGYEVLRELKANKDLKGIPVFILSNLGQEQEVVEGLKLQAEKYFIKSNYTPAEIVDKVNEFFKK